MVATVYITAAEAGLVAWDTFKKPPYTLQEYEQAYNNGINLGTAIEAAYEAGATKVVLERGKYPMCYSMTSRHAFQILPSCSFGNADNLTVEGNGSVIFAIFDSENYSPYQTGLARSELLPHQLGGALFSFEHTTNLKFLGFELRGDQYMRSWVEGESENEQTYGIKFGANNINMVIDVKSHGFRGDGLTCNDKGVRIQEITNDWSAGGLDLISGAGRYIVGAYRTSKIDLSTHTIYRNAVQLMGLGYLSQASFRNDELRVFFYDENNNFISSEAAYQTVFIYLPEGCRYIRFVAYNDERFEPTVTYGEYLFLTTGNSHGCTVRGEFFANMRGGISNLCGGTTLTEVNIHDNGTLKYGFPHYSSTTRYGVNFEDTYTHGFRVIDSQIRGTGSAILSFSRHLYVDNCDITDMEFGGVLTYISKHVTVKNSRFHNAGSVIGITNPSYAYKRTINFEDNEVIGGSLNQDLTLSDNLLLTIDGNDFTNCNQQLSGNGKNIVYNNNTTHSLSGSASWSFSLTGIRSAFNNHIDGKALVFASGMSNRLQASHGAGNKFFVNEADTVIFSQTSGSTELKGVEFLLQHSAHIAIPRLSAVVGMTKQTVIKDCDFIGEKLTLGDKNLGAVLKSSNTEFNKCDFKIKSTASIIDIMIREDDVQVRHVISFKDCTFDLTDAANVLNILALQQGKIDIKFIKCSFISNTAKSIPFFGTATVGTTNVTARAIGCTFGNVEFI